jgi:hypothetical protein
MQLLLRDSNGSGRLNLNAHLGYEFIKSDA